MPPEEDDNSKKTYSQIVELMNKLNTEASLDGRLIKIESQYKTGEEITVMIWKAIQRNDLNNNKNKINWTAIIQGVIITVVASALTYFMLRGGN